MEHVHFIIIGWLQVAGAELLAGPRVAVGHFLALLSVADRELGTVCMSVCMYTQIMILQRA